MDEITLKQFLEVKNQLDNEFDSHAFIFKYMDLFEADYIRMLKPVNGGFQMLDAWFGRTLLDNQTKLEICKQDNDNYSMNVKGNITSCAVWRKI